MENLENFTRVDELNKNQNANQTWHIKSIIHAIKSVLIEEKIKLPIFLFLIEKNKR